MLSLDLTILLDELFAHTLDVAYSDSSGIFGPAHASVLERAILIDMLLFLLNQ
jgi:hypothetical protein